MGFSNSRFNIQLLAVAQYLKLAARRQPLLKAHLRQKDLTTQIKVLDNSSGRYFTFRGGEIISRNGIHPNPDVCLGFSDAALGCRLLLPGGDQQKKTDAMKNYRLTLTGPDEYTCWFMEALSLLQMGNVRYGQDMGKGVTRYVN